MSTTAHEIPEDVFVRIMYFSLYDGGELSPFLQDDDTSGQLIDFRARQAAFMRSFATVSRNVNHSTVRLFWRSIIMLSDGDVRAFLSALEEPITEDDMDYGSLCKRVEVRIRGDYDHGCLAAVIAKLPNLRVFIMRNEYDQLRPVLRRRPVAVVDALCMHALQLRRVQFESPNEDPNLSMLKSLLGSCPSLTTLHLDNLCTKPFPDDCRPFKDVAPALRVLSMGSPTKDISSFSLYPRSSTFFQCFPDRTSLPSLDTLLVYQDSPDLRGFVQTFGRQLLELGFSAIDRWVAQGEGGHLSGICPSLQRITCVVPEALDWQAVYVPPPHPTASDMTVIYTNPQPTILSASAQGVYDLLSALPRYRGALTTVTLILPPHVPSPDDIPWLDTLRSSMESSGVRLRIRRLLT